VFFVELDAAVVAFFAVPTPAGACAFATLTVYRAAVTNAVNNIAAAITNEICFCIGMLTTKKLYIHFLFRSTVHENLAGVASLSPNVSTALAWKSHSFPDAMLLATNGLAELAGIFINYLFYYVIKSHAQRYTFFHNRAGSAGQKKRQKNTSNLTTKVKGLLCL
jgi:hypothetical protein